MEYADGNECHNAQTDRDHLVRLSRSLEAMPWGLITLDLGGVSPMVVYSNRRAAEFLRREKENLIGLQPADLFRSHGIECDLGPLMQSSETAYYDHEGQENGKTYWQRFHFIPYGYRTKHSMLVIEDTTENKIREGQYFQAQRLEALGQLAGGVAHDFNNILSIIDGYARMAKKKVSGNADALDYIDRIMQSVQRGAALTGRLLAFGRHKVMKDTVVDLGTLVLDQEPLLRPLMDASITLTMNVDEGVFIDVPPDNICQILMNLCINARDAMPDGGALIIETGTARDAKAFLRITDTGHGMTPEVKARIFDPFFTTKEKGKGTGLGLSMVYGLVKEMKGDIDVQSKVGEGTCITITLPLSERKPPTHETVEDISGNIHLDGYTALIAEDEPALLDLVSGMMEEMGAKVLRAGNGNEALMVQDDYDGQIDFLLTDVVMPELNGVRLAELFGSVRPDSKIMFMSGYPAQGQMARVALPENAFFISKPVDFRTLGTVLRKMVMNQNADISDRWKFLTGQWKSL